MEEISKIYVAGHTGLIGSAVVRRLERAGFDNLITLTHSDLELTDVVAVERFFDEVMPEFVVLAAGRVGGIVENQTYPADFITTNLAIQLNVLRAAHRTGVQKLILFASSCMYPRECPQPMSETALFSGYPEPTSLAYAVSKLAGMQLCLAYNQQYGEKRFIPVIPNSAFGPNDNFDPESGHVLSALIRRFHEAKQAGVSSVTLWGSGHPRREFIHADDIADACLALLQGDTSKMEFPLNIGTGQDFSICELAEMVARVVGYAGDLGWDTSKPDGAPRKLLDSSRVHTFGWHPTVDFESGLKATYQWYLNNMALRESRL
ncbi:MAG: GDP-L-fucose synthase [Gammaproteobacteria bacterium]|nr:GDP-L-fucose synthase [Gammaproteobacteria bacterium]